MKIKEIKQTRKTLSIVFRLLIGVAVLTIIISTAMIIGNRTTIEPDLVIDEKAVDETLKLPNVIKKNYHNESNALENFKSLYYPFIQSFESGKLHTKDGLSISYKYLRSKKEKGALLFLHGKSESMLKYAELAYNLKDIGYSLYFMDHRGMGLSERALKEKDKCHVEDFDSYVDDIEQFVTEVMAPNNHERRIILAHSMGGAAAALYIARTNFFDKALLFSPMMKINSGLPNTLTYSLSSFFVSKGSGSDYAFGQGEWTAEPFYDQIFTQSETRWKFWQFLLEKNEQLRSGGVTWSWLKCSIEAGKQIIKSAESTRTPVLLFEAGEDMVVRGQAQERYAERHPDCRFVLVNRAGHELLMEKDPIRSMVLSVAFRFIEE